MHMSNMKPQLEIKPQFFCMIFFSKSFTVYELKFQASETINVYSKNLRNHPVWINAKTTKYHER